MRVMLPYGRAQIAVELPAGTIGPLATRPATPLAGPAAAVADTIDYPNNSPPLRVLARGRKDACILVCDITRPVPNELILKPVLAALEDGGIPPARVLILVATGMHRASTWDEKREMLGEEILARCRVEDHDGKDESAHVYLGTTPAGVPAWIDARYVRADLKIAVGLIEPHFMAGYSGGRKLICPGVAALPTVRAWHSPRFLEHPLADAGFLDGNPVHEENTRIARMAGCDFIVNVTIDGERRMTNVVAGHMEWAFLEGAQWVERHVRATVPEPVDVAVASAAGFPLDATFYQTVKGICAAAAIVKPGGAVVIAASLSEGVGSSEFQHLLDEHPSLDEFMRRIMDADSFTMDQWQVEKLARAASKARIWVVSDGMPAEVLSRYHVRPAASVEEAVGWELSQRGPGATVAVMPEGPYVLASVA